MGYQESRGPWEGSFPAALVRRYFQHDVGRQAAALAYYLLFTLFPFLIFLSSLLGLLELDISGIVAVLHPLLPAEVLEVVEAYLLYVSQTSSAALMWFGLVFSVWFPLRAVRCLMSSVRRAYHLPKTAHPVWQEIKTLLYMLFLLGTIAATLVLMTVGQRALRFIGNLLQWQVPDWLMAGWTALRFGGLAVLIFAVVGLLYAMAQDTRQPARYIVPGTLVSLACWMALSAGYSYYVANISNYSLTYGTLGTVVVLLIWLYLTAVALIMGAEVNDLLREMRG